MLNLFKILNYLKMKSHSLIFRIIYIWSVLTFTSASHAYDVQSRLCYADVNALSCAAELPLLRGIVYNPSDPFKLDMIIDQGDHDSIPMDERAKLVRFFLAALTIPENKLWVNLSPYESDRIIDETVAATEIGEVLLEQDYMLKQRAVSCTHPDTPIGKKYWSEINNSSFGFSKIWIRPDGISIYDHNNAVYITGITLKAESEFQAQNSLLPLITEDINYGENFSPLRQMIYAVILAQWFKRKFADVLYSFYYDSERTAGLNTADPLLKEKVFHSYLDMFKHGSYNLTRKEKGADGRLIKRRYFSGGIESSLSSALENRSVNVLHTLPAAETLSKQLIQPFYLKAIRTSSSVFSCIKRILLPVFIFNAALTPDAFARRVADHKKTETVLAQESRAEIRHSLLNDLETKLPDIYNVNNFYSRKSYPEVENMINIFNKKLKNSYYLMGKVKPMMSRAVASAENAYGRLSSGHKEFQSALSLSRWRVYGLKGISYARKQLAMDILKYAGRQHNILKAVDMDEFQNLFDEDTDRYDVSVRVRNISLALSLLRYVLDINSRKSYSAAEEILEELLDCEIEDMSSSSLDGGIDVTEVFDGIDVDPVEQGADRPGNGSAYVDGFGFEFPDSGRFLSIEGILK